MLGHGFLIGAGGTATPRSEHGSFNNCVAYESYVGWEFEDGTNAEYTVMTGCSAILNVRGVLNGAGNTNWTGGNIVDNTIGVELYGGSNDNHGIFSGVNINHNTSQNVLSNDCANGYTFTGCHFYANGASGSGTGDIEINNSKKIEFIGGQLACDVIVNVGAGTDNGMIAFLNMAIPEKTWVSLSGTDLTNVISKGHFDEDGVNLTMLNVPKPQQVNALTGGLGFKNSWTDATGLMPLTYIVDDHNYVRLVGSVDGGTTTFATVVASLGSDLAPNQVTEFACKEGANSTNAMAYIQIDTAGDILWLSGSNSEVFIDVIYPRAV